MRILSWNINGLATTLQYYPWSETKSYKNLLDTLDADIICLQEIKTQRQKLTRDMAIVPGYDGYFSYSKTKQGYSGVAIYVKQPLVPLHTEERITANLSSTFLESQLKTDPALLDLEGRTLVMDFGMFVLFNIYFPNDSGDTRLEFKMDYHYCVRERIDQLLAQGRQVILAGDVNAVHEEIDHCDPEQSKKERNITNFKDLPHRQWVDQLVAPKGPLIDTCRSSHRDRKGMFTCWNTKINARPSNFGTRIDYIFISEGLSPWFKTADIRADILGSDHCPVYADFWDKLPDDQTSLLIDLLPTNDKTAATSPLLAANYPEFKQHKLSSFFGKRKAVSIPEIPSPSQPTTPASSTLSPPSSSASSPSTLKRKSDSAATTQDNNHSNNGYKKRQQQNLINSFFGSSNHSKNNNNNNNNNDNNDNSDNNDNNNNDDNSHDDITTEEKSAKEVMVDMEPILAQIEERQESNQVWMNIFQAPSIPKCRKHQTKCIEYTVNKKGPNQGRRFYLCSKPVGPQNSNSAEYRCDFFQWKHDKK